MMTTKTKTNREEEEEDGNDLAADEVCNYYLSILFSTNDDDYLRGLVRSPSTLLEQEARSKLQQRTHDVVSETTQLKFTD